MNSHLQSTLNSAINTTLKSLGGASGRNFQIMNESFGSQPLKWAPQLSSDLDRAYTDYTNLLSVAVEKDTPPDIAKVTTALQRILTAAFCLQIVTQAASPRVVVVQN